MKKSLLIHPDELSRKWIDRMVGVGVDTLTLHPVGGADAVRALDDLLARLEYPDYRALLDEAAARGLGIEYALHAASWLMPRSLFAAHPDWFRMDKAGNRVAETNFCPSNAEALAYFAARAVALAGRLYRSSPSFYFWLDDVKDSACHCPACRALSVADQHLLIENAVVRALREVIPGARLSHLAYCDALVPPTVVAPERGIFVEFAPIERDLTRPVADCGEGYAANLAALRAYFADETPRVLEYWFDNSLFSRWKKPPVRFVPRAELIRGDMAYYRAQGYTDVASFACFLGADYEALWGEVDISSFTD